MLSGLVRDKEINTLQVGYDVAKEEVKTLLFILGASVIANNIYQGKMELLLIKNTEALTIWLIHGRINAMSDRMRIAENANDGACEASCVYKIEEENCLAQGPW